MRIGPGNQMVRRGRERAPKRKMKLSQEPDILGAILRNLTLP